MAQTHDRQLTPNRPSTEPTSDKPTAAVLHTGGVQFASEKGVVERALGTLPAVASVDCNPVAQTSTVSSTPGAPVSRSCGAASKRAAMNALASRSQAASVTPGTNQYRQLGTRATPLSTCTGRSRRTSPRRPTPKCPWKPRGQRLMAAKPTRL